MGTCCCAQSRNEESTLENPLIELNSTRVESFNRYGSHFLHGYQYDGSIRQSKLFLRPGDNAIKSSVVSKTSDYTPMPAMQEGVDEDGSLRGTDDSLRGSFERVTPQQVAQPVDQNESPQLYPFATNSPYSSLDGYHGNLSLAQTNALAELKKIVSSKKLNTQVVW